jgi:hypothetical protein
VISAALSRVGQIPDGLSTRLSASDGQLAHPVVEMISELPDPLNAGGETV